VSATAHAIAGRWESPLTPASAAGGVERSQVTAGRDGFYWLEHDLDAGRSRIMHAVGRRPPRAITPPGVDVGSLAWEYGGGCFVPVPGAVIYSDRDDQRLYRLTPDGAAIALTPMPTARRTERYADGSPLPDGRRIICVRESHHEDGRTEHALVLVDAHEPGPARVLVTGRDFYAAPRVSPDGARLAWICWDKPNMAWDAGELWVAELDPDGSVRRARRVAGGPDESVLQPSFSPDGALHWISDRSGWWNIQALRDGAARPVAPQDADFAAAPWHHGLRSYGFLADGTIVAVRIREAVHQLVRVDRRTGDTVDVGRPMTAITGPHLSCWGDSVLLAGATATATTTVVAIDVPRARVRVLAEAAPFCDAAYIATPERLTIPRPGGGTVHGFLYRPLSPSAQLKGPTRAPLVVNLHGGPTDHARLELDPQILLWTSRGFAVMDLNYAGSSGFGRAYRLRLRERWGVADLDDCVTAVAFLAEHDVIDPTRVFARGGSAGGYLTLQCLIRSDRFRAGASRSGIADVEAWRAGTHDFESRYTDLLVGPPSEQARYGERSPARHVGRRSAPVLLVHGTADPVVPVDHARMISDAYRRAGRPHQVELFDEPHDFRRAASIRAWLAAELAFIQAHL
jgi:dipeptidyl aminopeptidase/acylaminoacyl peptidase